MARLRSRKIPQESREQMAGGLIDRLTRSDSSLALRQRLAELDLAHDAQAAFEGMHHRLKRIPIFARRGLETCLRHADDQHHTQRHQQRAAQHDRDLHPRCSDQRAHADAKQRSDRAHLRGTQERLAGSIFADLVGDPRLGRATGEGVA